MHVVDAEAELMHGVMPSVICTEKWLSVIVAVAVPATATVRRRGCMLAWLRLQL